MSSDSAVGRNSLCPCGSGKKYKKCCLSKDENTEMASQEPNATPAPPRDGQKGKAKTTGNEFSPRKAGNISPAGGEGCEADAKSQRAETEGLGFFLSHSNIAESVSFVLP